MKQKIKTEKHERLYIIDILDNYEHYQKIRFTRDKRVELITELEEIYDISTEQLKNLETFLKDSNKYYKDFNSLIKDKQNHIEFLSLVKYPK